MGRLVVTNFLTLDGVMQSPGHVDEDRRGGFDQGGWAPPYFDEVFGQVMGEGISRGGSMLFGRFTYEKMRAGWENGPEDSPFTKLMNERRKYVASTSLEAPLGWQNSTLLEGDVPEAVARLKDELEEDIAILGSGELLQSLIPHGLIDSYVLPIHPLVLGSGRRMFPDGGVPLKLRLVDVKPTTTGVVIASYEPVA
jgi:dihydrofolate reductase